MRPCWDHLGRGRDMGEEPPLPRAFLFSWRRPIAEEDPQLALFWAEEGSVGSFPSWLPFWL